MENTLLQDGDAQYLLTPDELSAVRAVQDLQNLFPGTKTTFTNAEAERYLIFLPHPGNQYPTLKNALAKAWVKDFFDKLLTVTDVAGMFLVVKYYQFCQSTPNPDDDYLPRLSNPWTNYWYAFIHGWRWRDAGDYDHWFGPQMPHIHGTEAFGKAVNDLLNQWGDNPATKFIANKGVDGMEKNVPARDAAKATLDAWYPNALSKLAEARSAIWDKQYTTATAMMAKPQLFASDYFFFFHLYLGLYAGKTESRALAKRLKDKKESSLVYDDAPFTQHLIYAVLLFLANPNGTYKWNNDQLKNFVRDCRGILSLKDDEVCKALIADLDLFAGRLNQGDGFPYVGKRDFNARFTNTLATLDAMRIG